MLHGKLRQLPGRLKVQLVGAGPGQDIPNRGIHRPGVMELSANDMTLSVQAYPPTRDGPQ